MSISAHYQYKGQCIIVGCASSAVRPVNPQLLSHTNFLVLIAVSIWIFLITTHAEVLSDPDSNVVDEQPARGKSALKAHNNPEAVTRWQQAGNEDGGQSQGILSAHTFSMQADRSGSSVRRPGSSPNPPIPSTRSD